MKIKEYLDQLRIADTKINNKLEELANLRSLAYSLGNGSFGERVQTSKGNNSDEKIIKLVDFQVQLNKDIDKYVDLKAKITKDIDRLKKSEYIDVLYKRYIHNESWRDISLEMNYAEKYVIKLHGLALNELRKIVKD